MKRRIGFGLLSTCLWFMTLGGLAAGQKAYPEKAIDIIVPFAPGGGLDLAARLYSTYLAREWKVPINIINKPGAGGILGTREALLAKPDGYTMLADGHAISTILGAFSREKLPFDWRNRTFVCQITADVVLYLVRPDAPWKHLKELPPFIRENPKKLKWGESGIGNVAGAQFFVENRISIKEVNRVNFEGGAVVAAALAGSHIDFGAQQLSEILGMVRGKKIRALAVVWPKRLPTLPEVPTVAEEGYPMLDIFGWQGMSGPPGLPQEVIKKWTETWEKAVTDPMFIKLADSMFKLISFRNSTQFKEFVEMEYKKYEELAKALGTK